MYEFDSVSVSSFEAASLASVLTERAADGWTVAGIVTAGSDVVAYLQRATATETDDAVVADDATDSGTADTTDTQQAADPAVDPAAALIVATTAEPVEPVETAAAGASSTDTAAGWAAGSTTSTSGGWNSGQSTTDTTSSWGGSSQQAPATQPAATPQVPAGWYADPAGRFELRYWDGGSWTEHVSRAGQQYTDPPVA
jgi:hypothetical protein